MERWEALSVLNGLSCCYCCCCCCCCCCADTVATPSLRKDHPPKRAPAQCVALLKALQPASPVSIFLARLFWQENPA